MSTYHYVMFFKEVTSTLATDKKEKLQRVIEKERKKLESIVERKAFNLKKNKILKASEKLDELINKFYHQEKKK